jgi:hypothetical protein
VTNCGQSMSGAGFTNHGCYRKFTSNSNGGYWEKCGSTAPARIEMTCYEALCQDPGDDHTELCREAVCALYNAQMHNLDGYPCDTAQVKAIVNGCLSPQGGIYLHTCFDVSDTTAFWNTTQCIAFFKGCRKA